MTEVDQAKLDQTLEQAYGKEQLPFCHDKTYKLKYSERWLCTLSKAEGQRCEAFKAQCGVALKPEQEPDHKGSGSVHVAPWISLVATVLFWALIASLVVAFIVSLLRMRGARQPTPDDTDERNSLEPDDAASSAPVVSGDKDVQRLLEKARRAADRGELGLAIDAAHAAAIQGLSAAGQIEVDRDRTNGDYLRDLRKAPPLQQDFKAIVGQVEVAQFGGVVPSRGAFDRVLDQVLSMLRRLAVLTLFCVAGFGLWGCGPKSAAGGEDVSPTGLYTLKRLLTEQGAKVHMRVKPLSKLDDDVGELVIFGRDLEEEEQEQVVKWVRLGGALVVIGESEFSDVADVEYSLSGCGNVGERGPSQDEAPLRLALIGERTMLLSSKVDPSVAQRIDATCGGKPYVVTSYLEEGSITFIPERELLTNASLSVADNARFVAELMAIQHATVELVGPWTGDGSQSPVQSLKSAGLMPVMLQLLGLALLLAVRQGTSFGARRDNHKLTRRAFSDHVRAVASTYARANAGRLAAGNYALLLVDQLRERTCPGQYPTLLQLAAAVARRVQRPETQIVELLVEAKTSLDEQDAGQGVNHKLIRELEQLSLQAGGNS